MKSDTNRDWTTNLQPDALAANTQFMRSTILPDVRKRFVSANLLNLINSSTDPQSNADL